MSDQSEKNPAPNAAIEDVQVVHLADELPDELLENVAGGDGMCSMMFCSCDQPEDGA